jgi:hypothetical protein
MTNGDYIVDTKSYFAKLHDILQYEYNVSILTWMTEIKKPQQVKI